MKYNIFNNALFNICTVIITTEFIKMLLFKYDCKTNIILFLNSLLLTIIRVYINNTQINNIQTFVVQLILLFLNTIILAWLSDAVYSKIISINKK